MKYYSGSFYLSGIISTVYWTYADNKMLAYIVVSKKFYVFERGVIRPQKKQREVPTNAKLALSWVAEHYSELSSVAKKVLLLGRYRCTSIDKDSVMARTQDADMWLTLKNL